MEPKNPLTHDQPKTPRAAAIAGISASTAAIRTWIFPRWMAMLGYVLALLLLNTGYIFFWGPVVFPLWVLLISVNLLFSKLKPAPDSGSEP